MKKKSGKIERLRNILLVSLAALVGLTAALPVVFKGRVGVSACAAFLIVAGSVWLAALAYYRFIRIG